MNLCQVDFGGVSDMSTVYGPGLSKDIFNVYMHRKASILDTRRCAENYMYVKNPSQFNRLGFELDTLSSVEHFWTELQAVCTTTPLNRRSYTLHDTVCDLGKASNL